MLYDQKKNHGSYIESKVEGVKSDKEHILIFVSAWKDEELEERYLRFDYR